jgi:lysozyme
MKASDKYLIAAGALVVLMLLPGTLNRGDMTAANLIASFEGFASHPYWDVNRWSWGYGTRAPGNYGYALAFPDPAVTITRAEALQELQAHADSDYNYLAPMITRPLSAGQWAALLSFSYNTGQGNADNLVPNINAGNDLALESQWKKYVYAGGQVNATLQKRREKEWQIWQAG